MEKILGRYIKFPELVHHKNEIKSDDKPKNLQLCANLSEHKKIHNNIGKETRFKQIYNFDKKKVLKMYYQYKSAIRVAKILNCAEITIRRIVKSLTGKGLTNIRRKENWGYVKK